MAAGDRLVLEVVLEAVLEVGVHAHTHSRQQLCELRSKYSSSLIDLFCWPRAQRPGVVQYKPTSEKEHETRLTILFLFFVGEGRAKKIGCI